MALNTEHLRTTLRALEAAVERFRHAESVGNELEREILRMAIVKGFELSQEVCFKLLKRRLKEYGHTARQIESLLFKDVLRLAARHGLLTLEETERWFAYRDNRNDTAHDYGEAFVAETLALIPDFLRDAWALESRLTTEPGEDRTP